MQLFSWLHKWISGRPHTRRTPARKPTRRFRPQLEALEDRWLPSTLTVTSPKDQGPGTLRAEIAAAHTNDVIVFSPKLDGKTITLTSGELVIAKNLAIQGPGAGQLTISGDDLSRVFEVAQNTTVTLSGLTISNGDGWTSGSTPGPMAGFGGGILNQGTLTVAGCTISYNSAIPFYSEPEGGGIYNIGTLTVSGCTVLDNRAGNGYGGGIYNVGSATVSNSTLSGNFAWSTDVGVPTGTFVGGAIFNAGSLTVSNSIFSFNTPDNIYGPYMDGGGNTFN
jgi:hypothetical protein